MPRLIGQEAGLHVPGVYQALLDLERERNERDDRRRARPDAFPGRRSRALSERLEAGEVVTVGRATVESALWERDRPPRPVRLPFDRAVRFVAIRADDRIVPAADAERDRAAALGR